MPRFSSPFLILVRSCVFFAVGGLSLATASAALINRWSFNNANGSAATNGTTFADSISGATATVVGAGATLNGSAITLPGTTAAGQANANVAANTIAAYIDLPNGIISAKTNLTVEIWATTITALKQQRLFDFGRMNIAGVGNGAAAGEVTNNSTTAPGTTSASDDIDFLANVGTTISSQQIEAKLNGGTTILKGTTLATTVNTEYHYVFTFEDGVGSSGANGGRFSWYRNGTFVTSIDLNFRLRDIEDVNNWLGRAQWTNDFNSNIAFNEVRLYDHAMSQAEISASFAAGPNASFPAPVAINDSVTMHRGQKARIAVLANDTGTLTPSTVAIVQAPQFGTAVKDSTGTILYTHTTGTPTGDSFTYRVGGPGGTSSPATVAITFSDTLRVANAGLNVPATPPVTAYQLVEAFPGIAVSAPVAFATPPGETQRLFFLQKTGKVQLVPNVAAATPTVSTFLDLAALLTSRGEAISTGGEQGLLGLAFHPQYATNGFFYLFYSVTKSGSSTVYERLSRFSVLAGNAAAADTTSEQVLIEQLDEASNHQGGDIHFGADGYLYVSLGDEGGQKDQYANSQRIDKDFFSAMMRIDVDKKPGNLTPNAHASIIPNAAGARYSIPADNPFVGATTFNGAAVTSTSVRTEFWAVGFRNPWRFSFDPPTGELWLGHVGQDNYESIALVTKGKNYGWAFYDGNGHTYTGSKTPIPTTGFTFTPPIYEYAHNGSARAVIGGHVYRGARIAALQGAYIFGDYNTGDISVLTRPNGVVTVTRITGQAGISAFGTDPNNGDVLVADVEGSRIFRLIVGTVTNSYPQTLSATNLFADLTDLSPSPGVLPYAPNLTFWSDFAVKRRWFTIPSGTSKMTWAKEGAWTYPDGMIWIKHFDMEDARTNPPTTGGTGSRKRIETRLLVKNSSGVYGVSYRWNAAGTEATLVDDAGADFTIPVTQNGSAYTQNWHIPSRAECLACHNSAAGGALSFNTRQLNQTNSINSFTGNQLDLLRTAGYFTAANPPDSPNLLPRHLRPTETAFPLEARARSFLAVNCSYCHRAGGTAPTQWDARPEITLAQMGVLNATAANNGGSNLNRLIIPGDTTHSIILNRVAGANGFTRMPPLATAELDQTDITLLTNWITQTLPSRQTYADWRLQQFNSGTSTQGDSAADPDGDGTDNNFEFLAGTQPLNAGSFLTPNVSFLGGNATVTFTIPANRSATVETSFDLATWSLWDVPGNAGLPTGGGLVTLVGPAPGPKQFFRVKLKEN